MKILFAADKFDNESRDDVSRFPGGAELTDAAIIEACPFDLKRSSFRDLNISDIDKYDLIVIGNLKTATRDQIDYISAESKYILFEHDMRICRYDGDWSRAKKEPVHYFFKRCICPHLNLKKLYRNSIGVIFLTHRQYEVYKKNPFFNKKRKEFLGSSAFNRSYFERVEKFRKGNTGKSGTAIFYSPHIFKGYKQSKDYCLKSGIDPIEIYDKTPDEVLDIFEKAEQFVYLPVGTEGAGRMPVEARFLGCKVIVNENVGVAGEKWWGMDEEEAYKFVKDTPDRFWRIVKNFLK
ncbi:MAG: hypothetical protein ABFR75_09015 [Acidobacteriota bacterium]